MAEIGLKYLVFAPLTEKEPPEASVEYSSGKVLSHAITVDLTVEINDVPLYGDNRIVENIKEFKSGKVTINGDDFSQENLAQLLGHDIKEENGHKVLISKGSDDGAYVGIGFFSTVLRNNQRTHRGIWLHKVKFGVPGLNLSTKGETITFQTPKLEGTVMLDIFDVWKEESEFSTENEVIEWLNEKAMIQPENEPEEDL